MSSAHSTTATRPVRQRAATTRKKAPPPRVAPVPYVTADVVQRRKEGVIKAMRMALGTSVLVSAAALSALQALLVPPASSADTISLRQALVGACGRTPAVLPYLVAQGVPVSSAQQVAACELLCNEHMQEQRRLAKERFERSGVVREQVFLMRCPCTIDEAVPHSVFQRGEENKKGAKSGVCTFKCCQACGRETAM